MVIALTITSQARQALKQTNKIIVDSFALPDAKKVIVFNNTDSICVLLDSLDVNKIYGDKPHGNTEEMIDIMINKLNKSIAEWLRSPALEVSLDHVYDVIYYPPSLKNKYISLIKTKECEFTISELSLMIPNIENITLEFIYEFNKVVLKNYKPEFTGFPLNKWSKTIEPYVLFGYLYLMIK